MHAMRRSHSSPASSRRTPCSSLNVSPLNASTDNTPTLLNVKQNNARPSFVESTTGKHHSEVVKKLWNDVATTTLLQNYKEIWLHAKKGSLRPKDWEQVTIAFNSQLSLDYTCEQVRNRMDNLFKEYKKEKAKTNALKGIRSAWKHFELLDTMWSTTAHCADIPGAFNTNSCQSSFLNEINCVGEDYGDCEDKMEINDVRGQSGERKEPINGDTELGNHESLGVVLKSEKIKEPRRTHLGPLARVFLEGWRNVADTMANIEKKRHQHEAWILKESQEHEERMLKLRLEEETKRLDTYMATQFDMLEMWTSNSKHKQSITLSANGNDLYDTIKAKVYNVVADMKEYSEMTRQKVCSGSFTSESADNPNVSLNKEIVNVFTYICKSYMAQISKVKEEVKHLKKQLAEKERLCLELTDLIDDLIPDPEALQAHEVTPMKQGNTSQGLKKVTSFEQETGCTFSRRKSILDDELCLTRLSGKEILLELEKETENRRLHRQLSFFSADHSETLENEDGLLLPWLLCDEAIGIQGHSSEENGNLKQGTFPHSWQDERLIKLEISHTKLDKMQGNALFERDKSSEMNGIAKPSWLTESSLMSIQSAEVVSQKIQFVARVEARELLLCVGTLQIH